MFLDLSAILVTSREPAPLSGLGLMTSLDRVLDTMFPNMRGHVLLRI